MRQITTHILIPILTLCVNAPEAKTSKRGRHEAGVDFIRRCYAECDREDAIDERLNEIWHAIGRTGSYTHTSMELEHGAKMAWRNSNRCIGRYFWDRLRVRDCRTVATAEAVYDELVSHINTATNDGNIVPTISVFSADVPETPKIRIWNHQLIRYAGYETDSGIIGDPDSVALTEYCQSRGWSGEGTPFDVLPLVIQVGEQEPVLFELPDEIVLEVPLSHPDHDWFTSLGLRWYAVPIISDMVLEIGGIRYPAAPFNGWYMGTEIGSRDLGDTDRYDKLPTIATKLGLETTTDRSLWKDEALAVLNQAVLHSFDQHGVRIVDHHTAAEQFKQFERDEAEADRSVTGDRSWLLPPNAASTTHIFDNEYDDTVNTPNFFYRDEELTEETNSEINKTI